jgi:exosome complex exonuclease RRP6
VDQSDFSLRDGDLITQVLERSKQEALQRYERYVYDAEKGQGPGGWYNMLSRTPNLFNREQFSVFRAVHQWRDQIARTEDEGSAQVMPKHVLYSIARSIPMDMPSLLACSHPISPTVRVRTRELLGVVQQAKLAGAHGPEMKDVIAPFPMETPIDPQSTRAVPSAPIPRGAITVGRILESPMTMRSSISRFWGATLDGASALPDETNRPMQLKDLRLVLPLPPLTAAVFEPPGCTGRSARESETADPGARAEHQYTRERKAKDTSVFVVQQLGGSRKRKAVEMANPPGPDVPPPMDEGAVLDGSDDEPDGSHVSSVTAGRDHHIDGAGAETGAETGAPGAPSKLSRGQRKRARLRAEAQRNEAARKEEDPDAKPFDYGAAPSILHPGKAKSDRAGGKTPLDPYAKSLHAPKAMRKAPPDFGGKSFTFAP